MTSGSFHRFPFDFMHFGASDGLTDDPAGDPDEKFLRRTPFRRDNMLCLSYAAESRFPS